MEHMKNAINSAFQGALWTHQIIWKIESKWTELTIFNEENVQQNSYQKVAKPQIESTNFSNRDLCFESQ